MEATFRPLPDMVGNSPPMRRLALLVRRCALLRIAVLLLGESGTGKELVALALHQSSPRRGGPFVAINGAALTVELAGSELFGHRRGAFTGAAEERAGAFRRAHGGTLFIDEVAALPLEVQAKMLRVVEDGVVMPVGGDQPIVVDVRLITATCEALDQMVQRRQFRADLYQRLATCRIQVPALRERSSDIASLADHLLAASEVGPHGLTAGAIAELREHPWPGNVRELRNVLVQAALYGDARVLARAHVAAALGRGKAGRRPPISTDCARRMLAEAGGNISAAARRAGLARTTFRDRLRLHATARSGYRRAGVPQSAA